MTTICDELRDYIVVDRCSLYLLDEATNELYTRVAQGIDYKEIRVSVGYSSLVGYSVLKDKTLMIKDVYSDKELHKIDNQLTFNSEFDQLGHYKTKNILCLPVKYHNKIIGAFQIVNKVGGFVQSDLSAMEEFSPIIALAVNNVLMTEKLKALTA